jgi:4-aminobutyrate aminotransferase-like enzyme
MADVTHGAHGTHGARGKMNNAFDPATATGLDDETRALVERRQRLLSPAYRLFYTHPVEVVRARGVLLYDADGRDYLDAYNNVVSVGHAHPRVTEAIAAQLGTLCTHTRYLQPGILDYAEDLLGTHSGRIGRAGQAMFTCTGSEANDLALRMARHHTGRRGIIVTAEAYHGNSDLTAGISPSLGEGSPLSPWVRRVPAPDSYRRPAPGLGAWLAGQVETQIRDLERRGDGVAAFIADSLFSSDGIYAQPTDVLGPVAEVVRRAGGLFVADEVQSGFARSGERMWGYQRHGLDPDIVTMGKPMGNGYPVAGVLVVPEVVAAFGRDTRYFNTFGGNTVAMAAAQVTLDVIRDEDLLASSGRVGAFLRAELAGLAARYEPVGDVRGAGLYVGIELVRDRASRTPDPAAATAVVNGLRQRRVLISATGEHGNVLKIRPPLVFSKADASRLLTELDAVLGSLPV